MNDNTKLAYPTYRRATRLENSSTLSTLQEVLVLLSSLADCLLLEGKGGKAGRLGARRCRSNGFFQVSSVGKTAI